VRIKMLRAIQDRWDDFFEGGLTNLTAMWNDESNGMPTVMYRRALLASVFTLCPGGGNVESFRVSEALEAGSIPIIESTQEFEVIYPMHPMPYVRNFDVELEETMREIMQAEGGERAGMGQEGDGSPALRQRLVDYWRNLKVEINRKMLSVLDSGAPPRLEGREKCGAELEEALASIRESIAREQQLQAEETRRRESGGDDARDERRLDIHRFIKRAEE
jgi:hypothetical protein